MAGPSAVLVLNPGSSRCYEHIADILTFSALTIGGAKVLFVGSQRVRFACLAADVDLSAPLDGFDAVLATGELPSVIYFFRDKKMPPPPEESALPGLKSINSRIVAAIFAVFAEKANDWVKLNVSTDYHKWPPVSNFARVVRNAIAHGGTVNLNSPGSAKVTWRGVAIDYSNNGLQLINNQLSLGDLLMLMLELDMELDSLGAPLDI